MKTASIDQTKRQQLCQVILQGTASEAGQAQQELAQLYAEAGMQTLARLLVSCDRYHAQRHARAVIE